MTVYIKKCQRIYNQLSPTPNKTPRSNEWVQKGHRIQNKHKNINSISVH